MAEQPLPVRVIAGEAFDDFEGFQRAFCALLDDHEWHGNLDAFNDILRGGFGTPDNGWVFRWTAAERSRGALGYPATIKRLRSVVTTCHPSNREHFQQRIDRAMRHEGPTPFDEVVEIIRSRGLAASRKRTASSSISSGAARCTAQAGWSRG